MSRKYVPSACWKPRSSGTLFPKRQRNETRLACWGPAWSPLWPCAFHFQTCLCLLSVYLLAVIHCWGRKSIAYLIYFELFFGPLKENSSKYVDVYFPCIECICLRLILLDAQQITWHSWIWKEWEISDCHSQKSGQTELTIGSMQQHSSSACVCVLESWRQFLTCLYWVCSPLQSSPLAVLTAFTCFLKCSYWCKGSVCSFVVFT